VLAMIRADRAKDGVDRALLKSMVRMLLDLGIYEATFLAPFLHDSELLYGQEGLDLCTSLSVPAYLLHCETRLTEEHDRCVFIFCDLPSVLVNFQGETRDTKRRSSQGSITGAFFPKLLDAFLGFWHVSLAQKSTV
jgi:hypothetical protein